MLAYLSCPARVLQLANRMLPVGVLLLLEHPVTNTPAQTATENTTENIVRPMPLVEQEAFREQRHAVRPRYRCAGTSPHRL